MIPDLRTLHSLINPPADQPSDFVGALKLLVDRWRTTNDQFQRWCEGSENDGPCDLSDASPTDPWQRLEPLLAECFCPIHGSANQCALLSAWRQDRQATKDLLPQLLSFLQTSRRQLNHEQLLMPLQLRIDVMQSMHALQPGLQSSDTHPAPADILIGLLGRVRNGIGCSDTKKVTARGSVRTSEGWSNLPALYCDRRSASVGQLYRLESQRRSAGLMADFETAVRDVFKLGATDQLPWRDPGVAYLADLMVQLRDSDVSMSRAGHSQSPNAWLPGHSWILMAVDDRHRRHPDPTGMLLLLRIDVLADGCGAVYPDPVFCAHVLMEQSFQNAFRNAWQVILNPLADTDAAKLCDYRWSVTVMDDSRQADVDPHRLRKLPLFSALGGNSVELAVAAGLRSAVKNVPLDRRRAATASFAERHVAQLDSNPFLKTVFSLEQKDKAFRESVGVRRAVSLANIDAIVVADQQAVEGILQKKLISQTQFDSAWLELSQAGGWTQEWNRRQRQDAEAFFKDYCFADTNAPFGSYILNDMQRMPDDRDPPELQQKKQRDDGTTFVPPINLTDKERNAERQAIVRGHLRADPVNGDRIRPLRLKGDSGMGKTSLLHCCAWTIANGRDGRIPVLLTGLSQHLQFPKKTDFLQHLADTQLEWLPNKEQRVQWLESKTENGEIVFLLDAIDQTDDHWGNLPKIVQSFPKCSFLVTMRDEALQSKYRAWKNVAWDDVDVLPFSRKTAREYLGSHADFFFSRLEDSGNKESGSVLTIPLLLNLLRRLADAEVAAGSSLEDFPDDAFSRYAIYERVICGDGGLSEHGYKTVLEREEMVERLLRDHTFATEQCSVLAWWQLKKHYFETTIPKDWESDWFDCLETALREGTDKQRRVALQQVNFITDRQGTVTWRHRSFLEFLGGRRLAKLFVSPDTRQEVVDLLREIHKYAKERDRREDWRWTLRFALCHAREGEATDELALQLIRNGNPWIVFDSINEDGLKLSEPVEQFVQWLVHRKYSEWHYGEIGLPATSTCPAAILVAWWKARRSQLGEEMFRDEYRDSEYIDALLDLRSAAENRPRWFEGTDWEPLVDGRQLALPTVYLQRSNNNVIKEFLNDFVDLPVHTWIPPKAPVSDYDVQELEAAGLRLVGSGVDRWAAPIDMRGVSISRFFVTNELYHLYDRRYKFWGYRSIVHNNRSQPADVNWYMARSFGEWLTQTVNDGRVFCLPTEWEWECAVRWGTVYLGGYWWGEEFEDFERAGATLRGYGGGGMRSKDESQTAHDRATIRHIGGLLDPVGNVGCWCGNRHSSAMGASRVVRGSTDFEAPDVFNRITTRDSVGPVSRGGDLSFRLVSRDGLLRQSSPESE